MAGAAFRGDFVWWRCKTHARSDVWHVHYLLALSYGALRTKRVLVRCLSVSVSLCFEK